jgi:hypothetical protein
MNQRSGGVVVVVALWLAAGRAGAQVDPQLAANYFKEAALLCERDGGRLWGQSLCGPMVFADAATRTIATNQPAPEGERPAFLGYANSAAEWGGKRWATYVWQIVPREDAHARGRLLMHESFHRLQPQLGFIVREGNNEHLDTLEGRYWLQLEWRALAAALGESGAARKEAVRDALAFRRARHAGFDGAAENERLLEINEGLAQYTGTVTAATSRSEAVADAIEQLAKAPGNPSFVRTFAYPSGTAFGLLLDEWAPGWTHKVKSEDDLARWLAAAAGVEPRENPQAAASRYGGAQLRGAEEKRAAERKALVGALRRTFVEGPVLVLPSGQNSFSTNGITPIPGAGTVYPTLRSTGEWGVLEAERALWALDRSSLRVPAPIAGAGPSWKGAGWTLELAPGWKLRPGARAGDFEVVRQEPAEPPAPK